MKFVEFIKGISERSGWAAIEVHSDKLVSLPFQTDEGIVSIWITPCGQLDGKTVLEFSSPGIPVPDDPDLQFQMMHYFMLRNGTIMQGHWGIEKSSNGLQFTVFVSQIAETMDPPEFETSVRAVCKEYQKMVSLIRKGIQESSIDF